jgi:transcriptional regulator with XRE-family HTH domain
MEHSVKQRLMQFLKYKKLSQGKFERACNLSNGYINNFKNSIGAEKLQNIFSAFPELNKDWLLSGEGEMLVSETPTEEKIEEISPAVPAVNECLDCRILQVRLEEKQATIDSLREQLDQAQDANRELLALLKQTIVPAESEHQKKKII